MRPATYCPNTVNSSTALRRWVWLVLIALTELTWLAIRKEAPSTGPLSYAKGLPSIFITSLAVVLILARTRSYGRLRELPIFHEYPRTSWWMVLALGQDVISQPAKLVIGSNQFTVAIYPACAGYEGIGLMVLFAGVYLWLFRKRLKFPQAYVLLPCAILAIWLVNAVRMAGLVLFGTYVSRDSDGWLPLPGRLAWLHRRRIGHGGGDAAHVFL